MSAQTSGLPQHLVEVLEPGRSAEAGWVGCEIDRHIEFDTMGLESYCFGDWNPLVYDAFVVAAAVECCDRTKARRGQIWGRDISLRVPVHDPIRWSGADVGGVLAVLTGDKWNLEFIQRNSRAPRSRQRQLPMDNDACAVMPFSNGLDSYVVSCLMREKYGELLLVRLGTGPSQSRKEELPFAGVPFRIKDCCSVESSFRTRAFKFAVLAGVGAFLGGLNEVIVAESGQGILGPPLVRMGPEHEDVRGHPYFLDRMACFFRSLLGADLHYVFPRIWHTKAETLREYLEMHPNDRAWEGTRSCWQDQRHASVGGVWRQCGVCSACLLRRMSLHSAGCQEDGSAYIWENLAAGSFPAGAAAEYAQRGDAMYRHFVNAVTELDQLAKVRRSPSAKYGIDRQIRRLCQSPTFDTLDEHDVRAKVERLLEQHANEWGAFKESLGKNSCLVQLLEQEDA